MSTTTATFTTDRDLLVAQEGNFSIDMADGRMGLLYYRKKSGNDVACYEDRPGLQAARVRSFDGRLRFRRDEMWIVTNDRLLLQMTV